MVGYGIRDAVHGVNASMLMKDTESPGYIVSSRGENSKFGDDSVVSVALRRGGHVANEETSSKCNVEESLRQAVKLTSRRIVDPLPENQRRDQRFFKETQPKPPTQNRPTWRQSPAKLGIWWTPECGGENASRHEQQGRCSDDAQRLIKTASRHEEST